MIRIVRALYRSAIAMIVLICGYSRILYSVTRVELVKRYSGSALGKLWIGLYPVLLLCIYLFVYLVVFKMRFPGFSEMDYALYVFCGLVPFIGVSESLGMGCVSLRQNMHLIKNVMLPIELVPIRAVLVSMVGQMVGMTMVAVLLALTGTLSWHVVWLPVVLVLQFMFLVGVVLILASLAVALPDIAQLVNLSVMLLMFVSPIGFKPDMVPQKFALVLQLNPIYYMIDAFRAAMIADQEMTLAHMGLFAGICIATFAVGSAFFARFKNVLVDYE